MPQCPNACHRRGGLPVRVCPDCGELVNGDLPARQCSDDEHARRKQHAEAFCMHCGARLIELAPE